MRDLSRQRIEWMINSGEGDLLPEALRQQGSSVGQLLREACREMLDEVDHLEQRLRITRHEIERERS